MGRSLARNKSGMSTIYSEFYKKFNVFMTNNQYLYPAPSTVTTLPVCDILGVEESLMTIENGGQVANWSRLQHNRTTSFGGKMCYNYNLSKYG